GASHAITPRTDALNLIKVLRTIYKFRSVRGAVHISSTYRANHMDARMMIENVRWAMNETLRIFWQGDREAVARAIRELLQFDVPCVGVFEDVASSAAREPTAGLKACATSATQVRPPRSPLGSASRRSAGRASAGSWPASVRPRARRRQLVNASVS